MSLGLSDKDCASHGDTRPADCDDTPTHSCVFDCHTGHSGTVDTAPIAIASTTRPDSVEVVDTVERYLVKIGPVSDTRPKR